MFLLICLITLTLLTSAGLFGLLNGHFASKIDENCSPADWNGNGDRLDPTKKSAECYSQVRARNDRISGLGSPLHG
jgi:hypothetical protein